ncbi:MAG: acyclic terpene utilization AtuA family protein [Hasllibacter sp.]
MTRVLVPSGALGLGWEDAALERGIAAGPDLIAIDGGSTDSGPSYLGRGVSKYSRASTKAEWGALIDARARAGCPLVIGTAGTCGTGSAVDWLADITRECLAERGLGARVALLRSDQDPAALAALHRDGRLHPLPGAPDIDPDEIARATNAVALAGAEQIAAALDTGADIVIAGRTTDTAIIAALPLMRGEHPGAAWHGAKIGECGALCATNPQSGVLQIDFGRDGFTATPHGTGARCTPRTVAAHMLYENADPHILHEPGGHLDVTRARHEQADERSVRVTGSEWVPAPDYRVKLEAAGIAGFQTLLIATVRDPRYVAAIDEWCAGIEARHAARVRDRMGAVDYTLDLRRIGVDATLGPLEPGGAAPPEVGLLAVVTAGDQATATDVARLLNPYLLHHPLTAEEEQPTFSFPFSPAETERGPLHRFLLHHTMTLADPMDAFRLETFDA